MAFRQALNRLVWAVFKRETVGFDAHGNKYYRLLDKNAEGEYFERRMVKYAGDWDPLQVPPEWLQWLRKVRKDPPTNMDVSAGNAERQAHREMAQAADAEAAEAAMRWQQSGRNARGAGDFTQQLRGHSTEPKE